MQYANKKVFLRLQDFEMIIEELKSFTKEQTGWTLYGNAGEGCIRVNQITINENHDDYLKSKHINQLAVNDSTHQYLGEWFYHADFKGWIDDSYHNSMRMKSLAASKVQKFKSPVVIGFNIIDGDINAVAELFSIPLGVDIWVKGANKLEYISRGMKLMKC